MGLFDQIKNILIGHSNQYGAKSMRFDVNKNNPVIQKNLAIAQKEEKRGMYKNDPNTKEKIGFDLMGRQASKMPMPQESQTYINFARQQLYNLSIGATSPLKGPLESSLESTYRAMQNVVKRNGYFGGKVIGKVNMPENRAFAEDIIKKIENKKITNEELRKSMEFLKLNGVDVSYPIGTSASKADDLISEARKYKTAEEYVKAQTGNKFGEIKKIDINKPQEQAYISDFADKFQTQKSEASGLTYSTLDKMGSLNTALKQKGFKGISTHSDFKGVYSLDKVINNPTLFEKYPDLKKTNVIFADFHTPTQRGIHIGNDIFLNSKLYTKDPTNIESTLVHEVEHAIQDLDKKLPKFSQFEQGRGMNAKEYSTDLREEGARKKQQEYLDTVKTKSQLIDIWNKAWKK